MATKLFLLVDGINGGSTDIHHQGWFEIEGYDLDLTGLAAASSGGAGVGKAQFSPLMVDLALNSGLAEILKAVASGEHLAGIKLEGIKTGAEPVKVFDLTLADVTVKTVHEENGAADHLAFDYTQIGLQTYSQTPDGHPVLADSFGWDVKNNLALSAPPAPVLTPGTEPSGGAGGTKLFLLVDGSSRWQPRTSEGGGRERRRRVDWRSRRHSQWGKRS